MDLPPFSPASAINLTLETVATALGIGFAAWLGFRTAGWQLRTERATEQQLRWLERATSLWTNHRRMVASIHADLALHLYDLTASRRRRIEKLCEAGDELRVHLQLGVAFISSLASFISLGIMRLLQIDSACTLLLVDGIEPSSNKESFDDLLNILNLYLGETRAIPDEIFETIAMVIQTGPIAKDKAKLEAHLAQLREATASIQAEKRGS